MAKYYAVKSGRVPGIYYSWDDCKAQVDGFSSAVYKSFKTIEEADEYMHSSTVKEWVADDKIDLPKCYAFTDGSFNSATSVYGFGGFLMNDGEKIILQGSGDDTELASMRNVAGEILGSMAAINKAIELGLKELTIFYDYTGVELFVTSWKPTKAKTIEYANMVKSAMAGGLNISFVHVSAHTGIPGNEEADVLAKEAVGLV